MVVKLFVVFTAVTMKNAVFLDVVPCRFYMNRRFGGKYRLHLQGKKIRERGTSVSRWLQLQLQPPAHAGSKVPLIPNLGTRQKCY
jgi:hypothetical protein